MRQKGLKPVVDERTTKLILGEFPGTESLKRKEYYAHHTNKFWEILGRLLNFDKETTYKHKMDMLLMNKIGLWDVIKSREIAKSKPIFNDFQRLFERYPSIEKVFFNGKDAESYYGSFAMPKKLLRKIELIPLPSTSGRNKFLNEQRWDDVLRDS